MKRLYSRTDRRFTTDLEWPVCPHCYLFFRHPVASAIHLFSTVSVAHLNMGLVLALMGMKDEAVEVYRRCSQLDGSGLKDPRTHETTKISALFNLGRLHADDGQYTKAIDVYNEAIQRMPTHYQPQVT